MGSISNYQDVIVVGAGLSGINAGYRIQTETTCSYTILESREAIGGTWSLFKYPGIRSDSDMFTLGFPFYPWVKSKSIADGSDICEYINDTAQHFGIDKKIQFQSRVSGASWSSKESLWTVEIEDVGRDTTRQMTTRFLIFASGYYDYSEGFYPTLPGSENFKGEILKPQFWPEDLDYSGKKVVIVGSGATAITLCPNMAKIAKHVTLLQRSPSYFVTLPSVDPFATVVRKIMPAFLSTLILRFQNQLKSSFFFYMCRMFPNMLRKILRYMVKRQLPPNIPLDPHFNPSYNPWDQRVCIVPDGDMFKAMRQGKANIATGHIDHITSNSVLLSRRLD
jgi:monooxygenase